MTAPDDFVHLLYGDAATGSSGFPDSLIPSEGTAPAARLRKETGVIPSPAVQGHTDDCGDQRQSRSGQPEGVRNVTFGLTTGD